MRGVKKVFRLRKLVFISLACLLAFGLLEIAARLFFDPAELHIQIIGNWHHKDHPTLFWVQTPNLDVVLPDGVPLKTNSLGLRDDEVVMPKPKDVYRILSLGESSTWGANISAENAYSELLEKLLNERLGGPGGEIKHYEVVNAGVGAYTIWQSNIYLQEEGIKLDPDMVLIYHESNDYMHSGVMGLRDLLPFGYATDRQAYEQRKKLAPLLRTLIASRSYLLLRKALFFGVLKGREKMKMMGGIQRVPTADRLLALDNILNVCRQNGIKLVVIKPIYAQPFAGQPVLRDFAVANGLAYIDLPEMLDGELARAGREKFFFPDQIHPTVFGHRKIARALAGKLIPVLSPGGEEKPDQHPF